MLTVEIKDQFIEEKFKREFKGNTQKFIEKIINLLKNEEKELVKAYEKGELSSGEIAKKLNISKEEVLNLLAKYNVYYADYDLEVENNNLKKFETKLKIKHKI